MSDSKVQAIGDWNTLVDPGMRPEFPTHQIRFVKADGRVIGAAMRHIVLGTDPASEVWCEVGLIQWEPWYGYRPLFTVTSPPGANISLSPKIVCEICGDEGTIENGHWISTKPNDPPSFGQSMGVLTGNTVSGVQDGEHFSGVEDDEYELAVRRDLGDKVPEEEANAETKIYDFGLAKDPTPEMKDAYEMANQGRKLLPATWCQAHGLPTSALYINTSELSEKQMDFIGGALDMGMPITEEEWRRRVERTAFIREQLGYPDPAERIIGHATHAADEGEMVEVHMGAVHPEDQVQDSLRKQILDETAGYILGDRNISYGPPHIDFQRTAEMLTSLWGWKLNPGAKIEAHDIATIIQLVKLSRIQWSPGKRDNWADSIGYAACGWEAYVLTHPDHPEHPDNEGSGNV